MALALYTATVQKQRETVEEEERHRDSLKTEDGRQQALYDQFLTTSTNWIRTIIWMTMKRRGLLPMPIIEQPIDNGTRNGKARH